MTVSIIGLDTARSVFQVRGVDAGGKVELERRLQRSEVAAFFDRLPRCVIVMEACASAHHRGRMLRRLDYDVSLIAPEPVRPFGKRGKKNDAADAAAIAVAASRPHTKFVAVRRLEQQGVLTLHSARSLLVKQQTMLANGTAKAKTRSPRSSCRSARCMAARTSICSVAACYSPAETHTAGAPSFSGHRSGGRPVRDRMRIVRGPPCAVPSRL